MAGLLSKYMVLIEGWQPEKFKLTSFKKYNNNTKTTNFEMKYKRKIEV